MVLLVEERPVAVEAKSKIDVSPRQFPVSYWKYLLAIALFGIGNSSNAFLILQTREIGASLTVTILIYAGYNLVAALISYPAGFLSDRLGRRNVLLVSLGIFLVTYLGFALSPNVVLIGVLFVFYGLYQGIFRAVGKALASDYVAGELRASGVGWFNTIFGLCGLVASLVGGWLWDNVGHASLFLFGAIFAAIGAIALLILVPANVTAQRSGDSS
jgi:MFS family permease